MMKKKNRVMHNGDKKHTSFSIVRENNFLIVKDVMHNELYRTDIMHNALNYIRELKRIIR